MPTKRRHSSRTRTSAASIPVSATRERGNPCLKVAEMSDRKVRHASAQASGSTVRRTRRTSRPARAPTVRASASLRSTSRIPTTIVTATAMLASSSQRRPGG